MFLPGDLERRITAPAVAEWYEPTFCFLLFYEFGVEKFGRFWFCCRDLVDLSFRIVAGVAVECEDQRVSGIRTL